MLYDLSNPLHAENFRLRCGSLLEKGCIAELKEKKPQRSMSQNCYLHVICGYFGSQFGMTTEDVKRDYFKAECNPGLFIREKDDPVLKRRREYLRSSADLTTEEMTLAIDRFRDWAAQTAGLYIPSPDEHRLIRLMEIEIERNRQYL